MQAAHWLNYPGITVGDAGQVGLIKGPTHLGEYLTVVEVADGRLGFVYGPRCSVCFTALTSTRGVASAEARAYCADHAKGQT